MPWKTHSSHLLLAYLQDARQVRYFFKHFFTFLTNHSNIRIIIQLDQENKLAAIHSTWVEKPEFETTCLNSQVVFKTDCRDFPGHPMVKALHSQCREYGFDP